MEERVLDATAKALLASGQEGVVNDTACEVSTADVS